MEEAKSYFDVCMELLDKMPDTEKNREHRISLLVDSYVVFVHLFRIPEYYELLTRYEPMVAALDSPHVAGPFYGRLGNAEWFFGLFDSSIHNSKRGAELCEVAGDSRGAALALNSMQWSHILRGDLERVVALSDEILRKWNEGVTLRRIESPLCVSSFAYTWLGRWEEALKDGGEALSLAREYSDDSFTSFAACTISWAYMHKGELDRAFEYAELAAEKSSTPFDEAFSQNCVAWARCRSGELEGNIERLATIIQESTGGQPVTYAIVWMPMLAEGYVLAGEYDMARQTAQETAELAERCGARWPLAFAHRLLGEIALKTNPDEAPPHFQKAIPILQEIKAENELALAYSGIGRYHKRQGHTEQARVYLTNALEIFERLGTLIEPDKVRKELAELPR
jgi:tetratricopeptide (TPR) repeat protein